MRSKGYLVALILVLFAPHLPAKQIEKDRLRESAAVLKDILGMPDGVVKELLNKAECILVFPSVKKFAIGIGASYGRGIVTCRSGRDFSGPWSAPAMLALEGGNIGLQLGGQATDFVLLVMNEKGANSVLGSKMKLGADAAVAAGPLGRDAAAAPDVVMEAEILSYSRSKGLFAGVSLEGSTLRSDGGANLNLYGKELSVKEIVHEGKVRPPRAAGELLQLLADFSPAHSQ